MSLTCMSACALEKRQGERHERTEQLGEGQEMEMEYEENETAKEGDE